MVRIKHSILYHHECFIKLQIRRHVLAKQTVPKLTLQQFQETFVVHFWF